MTTTHEWETLAVEIRDGIATVTLNRPERLNVMNLTMRSELRGCFERLRVDDNVAVVIVTGAGDAFCAGGDVNEFTQRSSQEMHQLIRERSHQWFRSLWEMPKPTIAAVNGVAAGGGANLVLACDVSIASEAARFGETFVRVGLMPDLAGLFLLPRMIGLHRAKELCMTGEVLEAADAHELGLFNRIVEPGKLISETEEFANQLANGPREAQALMKAIINRSFETSFEETLLFELLGQSYLFGTDEHADRLTSFLSR